MRRVSPVLLAASRSFGQMFVFQSRDIRLTAYHRMHCAHITRHFTVSSNTEVNIALKLSFHTSKPDLSPLESWKPSCSCGRTRPCSDHTHIRVWGLSVWAGAVPERPKLTWTAAGAPRPSQRCPHTGHCVTSDTETDPAWSSAQRNRDMCSRKSQYINSVV